MRIRSSIAHLILILMFASVSYAVDLQETLIGKTNNFLDNLTSDLSKRLLKNDRIKHLEFNVDVQ